MTVYRINADQASERADVLLHYTRNTDPAVRMHNPAGSSIGTVSIGIGKFEANVSYYDLMEAILLTKAGREAAEFVMNRDDSEVVSAGDDE